MSDDQQEQVDDDRATIRTAPAGSARRRDRRAARAAIEFEDVGDRHSRSNQRTSPNASAKKTDVMAMTQTSHMVPTSWHDRSRPTFGEHEERVLATYGFRKGRVTRRVRRQNRASAWLSFEHGLRQHHRAPSFPRRHSPADARLPHRGRRPRSARGGRVAVAWSGGAPDDRAGVPGDRGSVGGRRSARSRRARGARVVPCVQLLLPAALRDVRDRAGGSTSWSCSCSSRCPS